MMMSLFPHQFHVSTLHMMSSIIIPESAEMSPKRTSAPSGKKSDASTTIIFENGVALVQGDEANKALAPSNVSNVHLQKLQSTEHYTIMSHELVFKTAIRMLQVAKEDIELNSSISLKNLIDILSRITQRNSDELSIGPFQFPTTEPCLTAFDMSYIAKLLPFYIEHQQSKVAALNPELSKFLGDEDIGIFDLHSNASRNDDQEPKPLVFSVPLEKCVQPLFDVTVVHQGTVGPFNDSKMDGIVYIKCERPQSNFPVAQFECVLDHGVDTKIGQSMQYFQYLAVQQSGAKTVGPRHPTLSIRYSSKEIAVDVLYETQENKPARIPLIGNKLPMTVHSLHAVLSALALWIHLLYPAITSDSEAKSTVLCKNTNCVQVDGYVYKLFRKFGSSRIPFYFFNFVPGSQRVASSSDIEVIRYPKIDGSHQPTTISHIISLITCVVNAHAKGVCHADLRLLNIVFSLDGRAHIIDWDLSGRHRHNLYPIGYCHDIGWDGKRHPNALANELVRKEHDKYSLVAILRMIKFKDAELETAYRGLLPTIEDTSELVDACNAIDLVHLSNCLVGLKAQYGNASVSIDDWEERNLSEFTAASGSPKKIQEVGAQAELPQDALPEEAPSQSEHVIAPLALKVAFVNEPAGAQSSQPEASEELAPRLDVVLQIS